MSAFFGEQDEDLSVFLTPCGKELLQILREIKALHRRAPNFDFGVRMSPVVKQALKSLNIID